MVGKRSALVDEFARRYMPLLRSASETRFIPHIILDFHKDLHYRYNFKHLNIPGFRCYHKSSTTNDCQDMCKCQA